MLWEEQAICSPDSASQREELVRQLVVPVNMHMQVLHMEQEATAQLKEDSVCLVLEEMLQDLEDQDRAKEETVRTDLLEMDLDMEEMVLLKEV